MSSTLARTSKAAARLAEQFRSGRVEKTYLAIVEGTVGLPSTRRAEARARACAIAGFEGSACAAKR